jgi:hypothetical protein
MLASRQNTAQAYPYYAQASIAMQSKYLHSRVACYSMSARQQQHDCRRSKLGAVPQLNQGFPYLVQPGQRQRAGIIIIIMLPKHQRRGLAIDWQYI